MREFVVYLPQAVIAAVHGETAPAVEDSASVVLVAGAVPRRHSNSSTTTDKRSVDGGSSRMGLTEVGVGGASSVAGGGARALMATVFEERCVSIVMALPPPTADLAGEGALQRASQFVEEADKIAALHRGLLSIEEHGAVCIAFNTSRRRARPTLHLAHT